MADLISKISSTAKRLFFKANIAYVAKTFKPKFSPRHRPLKLAAKIPSPFLRRYSLINKTSALELLRKISFTKKDARAGWFGAGLPRTEVRKKNYPNLADWATQHLFMYLAFLPSVKNANQKKRILDIGCGIGYATLCLAEIWPKSDLVGIDYDKEVVQVARLFNCRSNIAYLNEDFFEYKTDERYDYIFALEVLEHIPAKKHDKFIKCCMDVLSSRGKLFISTPNALDEGDDSYSHIGLLNRKRARVFIKKYKDLIQEGFFIDNKMLLNGDPSRFVVNYRIADFEKKDRNLSHFHLIMRKSNCGREK